MAIGPAAAGAFSVERVTFQSGGVQIVGDLYLPEEVGQEGPVPAVIVTGAWMTIKEQMPAIYAREMASRGIAALAFDFRSWGESGGEPRSVEDPVAKSEDIVAAAEFLAGHPEIRADAIGGLGVCASAAYMVHAAVHSGVIKSLGFVAPGLSTPEIIETNVGGAEAVAALIETSRAAAAELEETGRNTLVPAASLTDHRAIMFGVPYYTEPDRGLVPEWDNTFNPISWEAWLGFDPQPFAPLLRQPLFVVHSEAAAIPQGTHQFIAAMESEAGQLWLEGVEQFDFYDRPGPVTVASDALARHFAATLQ
ncbi:hypothetical protein VE25_01780 [Devosia geojensis]|uniref:Xaa-Pro dipeptidyl-peptidase-like domain-containing protein n=1 Tax=Devosia geojensis TaxID=443610 RepID=A0A0F5FXD7_9HYPH|nr:hypothetical protein VE25_01780 [Devosia geojensis]